MSTASPDSLHWFQFNGALTAQAGGNSLNGHAATVELAGGGSVWLRQCTPLEDTGNGIFLNLLLPLHKLFGWQNVCQSRLSNLLSKNRDFPDPDWAFRGWLLSSKCNLSMFTWSWAIQARWIINHKERAFIHCLLNRLIRWEFLFTFWAVIHHFGDVFFLLGRIKPLWKRRQKVLYAVKSTKKTAHIAALQFGASYPFSGFFPLQKSKTSFGYPTCHRLFIVLALITEPAL